MAGDPYTYDPTSGTLYSGTPDNLGSSVDAIYAHGTRYTLSGSTLVPEDAAAPNVSLDPNRTTYLVADPYDTIQVTYGVQQRQLNRSATGQRVNGISGTVQVALGDQGVIDVTLQNEQYTVAGRRMYQTVDVYGNRQVANTAYDVDTNAQLQAALNDPNARYLSPREAMRSFFTRILMSEYQDLVEEYYKQNYGPFQTRNRLFSQAAYALASQTDLSALQVWSNYWV